MRRVLVLWADDASTNLGVRALGAGTAALAERVWGEVEVHYLNYGATDSPMRVGDPKALARELVTRRRGLAAWIGEFDVVLDTRAGDSFTDIYGMRRHVTMSLLAEIAYRSGTPVVMAPQTLGPFSGRRTALLARRSMGTARLVLARDPESARRAAELRIHAELATDVVFALPVPEPGAQRDVLLNVSGLLWNPNPHVDHLRYREAVTELATRLVAEGREVALLAHVLDSANPDNDVPAARELAAAMATPLEVVVPAGLDDVRRQIAGASLVVGARMHACLNALSVGTPAVAMAYSEKFDPLMRDLGWNAVVDVRSEEKPVDPVWRHVQETQLLDETQSVRKLATSRLDAAAALLRQVT